MWPCPLLRATLDNDYWGCIYDTPAQVQEPDTPPHLYEPNDLILDQVQSALHRARCVNEDVDALSLGFAKEGVTPIL